MYFRGVAISIFLGILESAGAFGVSLQLLPEHSLSGKHGAALTVPILMPLQETGSPVPTTMRPSRPPHTTVVTH